MVPNIVDSKQMNCTVKVYISR